MLGKTLFELERLEEALEAYRKAVTTAPDSAEALQGIIQCQLRLGHADKAMTTLKRALMVDPKNVDCHVMMVDLLLEQNKLDDATSHLKRALSADPSQNLLRRKLEEINRRLPILKKKAGGEGMPPVSRFETDVYDILDKLFDGRLGIEQAVKGLETIQQRDPNDLFVREELASVLFQARRYPEARELYTALAEAFPGNIPIIINLAKSRALSNEHAAALQLLKDTGKSLPHDPELALALVELLLIGQDYPQAMQVLQKTLAEFPELVHGLFLQAFISLQEGNLDLSYEAFQKLLRLAPDDEEIALWYSRLMILRDDPREGLKLWDRFQDGIESLQEIISRIELQLAAGDASQVAGLLRKIGDYQPRFLEDHLLFGKAFFYAGDFTGALARFEDILEQEPRHGEAMSFLALCHLVKNKTAKFWMAWQKAIDNDSLYPTLLGLLLRHVLNFAQRERVKSETKKLLDLTVRRELDRGRLSLLMKAL